MLILFRVRVRLRNPKAPIEVFETLDKALTEVLETFRKALDEVLETSDETFTDIWDKVSDELDHDKEDQDSNIHG